MKKFCSTSIVAVFMLIISEGLQAQNSASALDQLKLAQLFVGTSQHVINKDSTEVIEAQQYGNAFVENVFLVINGKKSLSYVNNYCFPAEEGMFKGFVIWPNGGNFTWIGSFITDKKFTASFVRNFIPESSFGKMDIDFDSPATFTVTRYNSEGEKTSESKYSKVK